MESSATAKSRIATKTLVLYDGECSFCNASVLKLLRIDRRRRLSYASQQSALASRLCDEGVLTRELIEDTTTVILVENPNGNTRIWFRSDAGIRAVAAAGGIWKLALGFLIIPRVIRDGVYNFIARNRYRWFGRHDESSCRLLTPEERQCFLD